MLIDEDAFLMFTKLDGGQIRLRLSSIIEYYETISGGTVGIVVGDDKTWYVSNSISEVDEQVNQAVSNFVVGRY